MYPAPPITSTKPSLGARELFLLSIRSPPMNHSLPTRIPTNPNRATTPNVSETLRPIGFLYWITR